MNKDIKSDNRINSDRPVRSYPLARHHAWGGLALLSLLGVVRLLFPGLPDPVWVPLASLLVFYVLVWLFLAYRYRNSLKGGVSPISNYPGREKSVSEDLKERSKLEKKKIKAGIKEAKKREG